MPLNIQTGPWAEKRSAITHQTGFDGCLLRNGKECATVRSWVLTGQGGDICLDASLATASQLEAILLDNVHGLALVGNLILQQQTKRYLADKQINYSIELRGDWLIHTIVTAERILDKP